MKSAMSFQSNIFASKCIELDGGNYLHFINIPTLDDKITTHIDNCIVSICEGAADTDLATIKKRLINHLKSKKGSTLEMGAISEFFGHLYLTEIGFNQEFLFLNLSDSSVKKGFDGYYTLDDETWIYESKSGSIATKSATHESKVSLAYSDLKNKISGNPANNPWQNAYNHACQIDVGTDTSIRQNLKALSDAFTHGKRQDIGSFNIIPGSTLFLEGAWTDINEKDLAPKLVQLINTFCFKKIHIVCVNKASIDLFWAYLES